MFILYVLKRYIMLLHVLVYACAFWYCLEKPKQGSVLVVIITKFLRVWLASPVFKNVEICLQLWVDN